MNRFSIGTCLLLTMLFSQHADARRIVIEVPEQGQVTHTGGRFITSVERHANDRCSLTVTFSRRARFLVASMVGRPFSLANNEAPEVLVMIGQPTSDGRTFTFNCLTSEQIFYRDPNSTTRTTIALSPKVGSATSLFLDVDF